MRGLTVFLIGTLAASGAALADDALEAAPPPAPYAQVSELVALPDFIPGLGTLYVDPDTLPVGPFLAYDHNGELAATVYMAPIAALEGGTAYDGLKVGDGDVESVDIVFNAGHPGVEEPHVHVIIYHDEDSRARLAE